MIVCIDLWYYIVLRAAMRNKVKVIPSLINSGCTYDNIDTQGNNVFHWISQLDTFIAIADRVGNDARILTNLMTSANKEGVRICIIVSIFS